MWVQYFPRGHNKDIWFGGAKYPRIFGTGIPKYGEVYDTGLASESTYGPGVYVGLAALKLEVCKTNPPRYFQLGPPIVKYKPS